MPNHALIVLTGHIGKAPELKSLQDGTPVLKFSLCVNTGFGEKKNASWYECAFWGKRGESVSKFLDKGKPVTVVGEPSIRKWQADNGKNGTSVDVRVADVVLLGGKDDAPKQDGQQGEFQNPDEVPF